VRLSLSRTGRAVSLLGAPWSAFGRPSRPPLGVYTARPVVATGGGGPARAGGV